MDESRNPLAERFPALTGLDQLEDSQKIAAFQDVLDRLQHELDDAGREHERD